MIDLNRNDVNITELLVAIQVFHEVLSDEYPNVIQCHPYIELHPDGSGRVVSTKGTGKNCGKKLDVLELYNDREIFTFTSLKSLVNKAKQLCKKHKLDWIDWNYKY